MFYNHILSIFIFFVFTNLNLTCVRHMVIVRESLDTKSRI